VLTLPWANPTIQPGGTAYPANVRLQARAALGTSLCKPLLAGNA
jgi:hypothetical protein